MPFLRLCQKDRGSERDRLDRMTGQFLFQLISRRYGRGSMILTFNKAYGDWGDNLAEQHVATAILCRLQDKKLGLAPPDPRVLA